MNFVSRRRRLFWLQVLLVTVLTCLGAAQNPPTIQNLASKGTLEDMLWADFRDYQPSLQKFYEPTVCSPAWVQGTRPSSQALSMIAIFKNAWTKGLEPEDYDAS